MSRKPSAILQYKLRIRESLRRRIEQAAKVRGVSANYEMTSRLERSFEQEGLRTIDESATALDAIMARIGDAVHGLNKQGDLLRAADALVAAVDLAHGEARERAISKAAEKVKQIITMIDKEAALTVRRMHTTGADQ